MAILRSILQNDSENMNRALIKDEVLKEAESRFYDLLRGKDIKLMVDLESVFSTFTVRVMQIAYLQGLKDFNSLFIELKPDVSEILDEYAKPI